MPEITIPDTISFTDNDIAEGAKRDDLTPGWYRFVTLDAVRSGSERTGSLMIKRQVAALADPNDANSTIRPFKYDNIVLPFENPDFPGHTKPKTAGICAQTMRALFPDEIPEMPRRIEGQLTFQGEPIDKSEEQAKREEVMSMVFEKLKAVWEDPTQLVGTAYYGEAYQNGDFMNIRGVCAELPADVTLVDLSAAKVSAPKQAAAPTQTVKKTNGKPVAKANGKSHGKR